MYHCNYCNKDIPDNEVITSECGLCRETIAMHKVCGCRIMCMKKYIKYTFSNKEAFQRIVQEMDGDRNVTMATISGHVSIVTKVNKEGLDLNQESYMNLSDSIDMLIERINIPFGGWGNFWEINKLINSESRHVFGSITLEIR
jgi:hypothetical protein